MSNYTGYNGDIKLNKRVSTPYGNGTVKGYFNGLVIVLIGCEKYRVNPGDCFEIKINKR